MEVRKKIGTKCDFGDLDVAEVFLWDGNTYMKTCELKDGSNMVNLESGYCDALEEENVVERVNAYLVIS